MLVELTDGSIALVDDCDYPLVSQYQWNPETSKGNTYARCSVGNRTIRMHRLILGAAAGIHVDHRNGNGLDNRRENLRLATPLQNGANKRTKGPASGLKGVYRADRGRRWKAIITVNYERRHLGYFDTPEEAAAAYDNAAKKAFGEFAALNADSAGRVLDGRTWDEFPNPVEVA